MVLESWLPVYVDLFLVMEPRSLECKSEAPGTCSLTLAPKNRKEGGCPGSSP